MISILWKWGVLSGAFVIAAALLPMIRVRSWGVAVGAAAVFGVANFILGFPLRFIAKVLLFLPGILTFGLLFLVVPLLVNMVLLKLTDNIVGDDLEIRGTSALLGMAVIVTLASAFLLR